MEPTNDTDGNKSSEREKSLKDENTSLKVKQQLNYYAVRSD